MNSIYGQSFVSVLKFSTGNIYRLAVREILVYNKMICISVSPNCEDKAPRFSLDTCDKLCL